MGNTTKFTPGPWEAEGRRIIYTDETTGVWDWVAVVEAFSDEYKAEQNANVALIAAAPDLYEAGDAAKEQMKIGLSAIQKLIEIKPENSKPLKRIEAEMKEAIKQMEQALAKARGEKHE